MKNEPEWLKDIRKAKEAKASGMSTEDIQRKLYHERQNVAKVLTFITGHEFNVPVEGEDGSLHVDGFCFTLSGNLIGNLMLSVRHEIRQFSLDVEPDNPAYWEYSRACGRRDVVPVDYDSLIYAVRGSDRTDLQIQLCDAVGRAKNLELKAVRGQRQLGKEANLIIGY